MGPLQESPKQNTYNVAIQKNALTLQNQTEKMLRKLFARTKRTKETVCTVLESEQNCACIPERECFGKKIMGPP